MSEHHQHHHQQQDDDTPIVVRVTTGWKRSERTSQDSETILWKEPSSSSPSRPNIISSVISPTSTTSHPRCGVCQENESRYTCPRCQLPYCSVACYKTHSSDNNNASNNNNNIDGNSSQQQQQQQPQASACTEAFYKNRVSSILEMESRERKESAYKMLNRTYHEQLLSLSPSNDNNNIDATTTMIDNDDAIISDELYELLLALENNDINNNNNEGDGDNDKTTDVVASLWEKMSPALRAMLEKDLQSGKLQDLVLKKWHPWWRQELVDGRTASLTNADNDNGNEEEFETPDQTLDDRLLKIPDWRKVRPKRQQQDEQPNLVYNLIDILYGICWTLRLYHGVANATENAAYDASATLWKASTVLGEDARYSTLEQCLTACSAASTKQYPDNGCNAPWSVLVKDCALLCLSPRLVGRALLEANDIFGAVIKKRKKQLTKRIKGKEENESSSYPSGREDDEEATRQELSKLRRVRKKTEFYLSFSQSLTVQDLEWPRVSLHDWAEQWSM